MKKLKQHPQVPGNVLAIHYVDIDSLKPAEYNPRTHDVSEAEQLKESLRRFGTVDPLIVNQHPDRNGIVVGGHFRLECMRELGYEQVPVVFVNLPLEKERELNLRLNRNTGRWDYELLKSFNMNILLDVGFTEVDLGNTWDAALETSNDEFDVEKELEKIQDPKTKTGELYKLGTHYLLCGDSTNLDTVKRLLGEQQVSMIYSDPPYNLGISYDKGISKKATYGGHKTDDSKTETDYRIFLKTAIDNALVVAKPDAHVFFWCDENYVGLVQNLFEKAKLKNRRICMWVKNAFNATPGIAFNKAMEPCVYATRGKPYINPDIRNLNELLNKEIGTGNRTAEDVIDLFNIWLAKRIPGQEYEHPTEKPPTLHEKPLRRCTKVNDVVLDLFGGSGSTLIACEQMKRRCFIIEQEPIFCDLIIRRYEKLSGKTAELVH
jgi:DNA modification methylase